MRANIPRNPNNRNAFELDGAYLLAMQTVSTSLMEVLPEGERLWEVLGKTEALLIEAQMTDTPLEELFPQGGVAGFCQAIIDEYRGEAASAEKTPAAHDRKGRRPSAHSARTPRGGAGALRYRRISGLLTACGALILAVILLWQSGLYRFLTQGSAFYYEELYNFENTAIEVRQDPLTFTVTSASASGLGQVIYADGEGYTVKLDSVGTRERKVLVTDEDGKKVWNTVDDWYVILHYTVKAGFFKVSALTPEPKGTARLTLADGTVYESTLTSDSSGPISQGVEYLQITVLTEIPRNVSLSGATLTVNMEPPVYRLWERIGMGAR